MQKRTQTLKVRISPEEQSKLRALAVDRGETVSRMLRRWTYERYADRFGTQPSPGVRAT